MMNIKSIFFILFFSFLSSDFFSQISANAGLGTINGFGVKKTFVGLNLGLEYPRSNQTTIYGRIAYYVPRNQDSTQAYSSAISTTTFPYTLPRNYIISTGYLTIEGGTRNYLINGYDNGFSVYGGSTILLCVNNIKKKFADWNYPNYNEAEYQNYGDNKGTILNLGVGLQGGLKYTFPSIGTFFCDFSGNYLVVRQASNDLIYESTNYPMQSGILFTFNFGYRKDFY